SSISRSSVTALGLSSSGSSARATDGAREPSRGRPIAADARSGYSLAAIAFFSRTMTSRPWTAKARAAGARPHAPRQRCRFHAHPARSSARQANNPFPYVQSWRELRLLESQVGVGSAEYSREFDA